MPSARKQTRQPSGPLGLLSAVDTPLALGLLRLCTEGRPSDIDAIALIHFALNHGIRILDTADVYSLNDEDRHYGESLFGKR